MTIPGLDVGGKTALISDWMHLFAATETDVPVVAAWGVNARPERVQRVLGLMRGVDWRCLGTTKDGHPRHPLYLKGEQPLLPFGGSA